MDPTKTNSYRRWRNKLNSKGFSKTFMSTDDSFKPAHPAAAGSMKQEKGSLLRKMGEETEVRTLLKTMEREFRKSEIFRKDKVAEIKSLIKQGQYRIPGKMVVDKWFP